MKLYIIYTETGMLLSKKQYSSWRDIQDEYENYKTSLGPYEKNEIIEYLASEYLDLEPSAELQVSQFLASLDEVWVVTFRDR